jgi:prepilin-type processing-associated H-X9-DG protein
LRADADAYARDGAYAVQNFGAAAQLQLKQAGASWNRESFLRFDLSSLTGVSSAKLRLFGKLDNTQSPSVAFSVYASTDNAWSETTVNWNTRPLASGNVIATGTVTGTTGQWYELDLTTFLQQQKAAGATGVTLVLKANAASNSTILFDSDEAANRPELAVVVPPPPELLRVNAGGGQYVDSLNRTFDADAGFIGGSSQQASYNVNLPRPYPQAAPGAFNDDPLLLDYRAGANFSFSGPLADGGYTVWLEFAEPNAGATAGQRVFDVSAEGELKLDNYDILADAGGSQLAIARTFNVTVRDGRLDLSFHGEVGEAMIGAISVAPTNIPAGVLPYLGVSGFSDPVKQQAADTAWAIHSASNLARIGLAALIYSNDNRGRYPLNFRGLELDGTFYKHQAFSSPRAASSLALPRGELSPIEDVAWVDTFSDYVYVGAGLNVTAGADVWMAYENPDRVPGEQLNVLFADGHVDYVARSEVLARYGGDATGPSIPRALDLTGDARIIESQARLRQMFQAMNIYSREFRSLYPPDFGTLYQTQQGLTPETFINPRGTTVPPPAGATEEEKVAWINASTDYVFRAAGRNSNRYNADEVVVYENPAGMSTGINLVFGDGHVEFREMRWALEAIARPRP